MPDSMTWIIIVSMIAGTVLGAGITFVVMVRQTHREMEELGKDLWP